MRPERERERESVREVCAELLGPCKAGRWLDEREDIGFG